MAAPATPADARRKFRLSMHISLSADILSASSAKECKKAAACYTSQCTSTRLLWEVPAALPQHSAVRLCLTGNCSIFDLLARLSLADKTKRRCAESQRLSAVYCGEAAIKYSGRVRYGVEGSQQRLVYNACPMPPAPEVFRSISVLAIIAIGA